MLQMNYIVCYRNYIEPVTQKGREFESRSIYSYYNNYRIDQKPEITCRGIARTYHMSDFFFDNAKFKYRSCLKKKNLHRLGKYNV
jgi:hypothetical protein